MTRKTIKEIKHNECTHCSRATICLLPRIHGSSAALLDEFRFSARHLKRGEHLCYQGQESKNLYILRAGMLKSYIVKPNGDEFVMGFYLPSDLFGWEGIDEKHHSISITALDQSNICVIPVEKMALLARTIPGFSAQLLQMVSRRIHQDNVALLRTTALQRVATFLLQLEFRYQQLGFSARTLQLMMSHQEIANYLRITPSTISRIFHELQRKKTLCIERQQVQLLDIEAIRLMADEF